MNPLFYPENSSEIYWEVLVELNNEDPEPFAPAENIGSQFAV